MFPQYLRFYGYTATEALNEYGITFFTLVNAMNRIMATEALGNITQVSASYSGGAEGAKIIDEYKKQARGISGILEEVRNIKK
jgi:hypothetical protein